LPSTQCVICTVNDDDDEHVFSSDKKQKNVYIAMLDKVCIPYTIDRRQEKNILNPYGNISTQHFKEVNVKRFYLLFYSTAIRTISLSQPRKF